MISQETKETVEIWKDIPGYHNYQASNLGRIRSTKKNWQNRIVKTWIDHRGYVKCSIYINPHQFHRRVHRLIALAFFGPSELTVNHKNGIKTDNRVDNLEWVTQRENSSHYYTHKRNLPLGVHCE